MADALALARALIRCPSVTPAEAGALAVLEGALAPAGFAVARPVFAEAGTPDIENLFATIGQGAPHLVLAGHTDVVPTGDAARWTHAPFAADVADGLLYGRGAVDMKGGLAAMLAAALDHVAATGMARGTLSVLVTGDEEGPAINGTAKLLAWARARGHRFDQCLLAEPTSATEVGDTLKIGRRGSLSGTLVVEGRQGHVAYPHKADNPARRLVAILDRLMATPLDAGTAHFDASNLEVVSIDTGNPAFNVIPAEMRARFNARFNDTWTPATLRASIEARAREAAPAGGWRIDWEPGASDSFLTAPGAFVDLVSGAVEAVTGRRPRLSTAGGTSDARFVKDHCPVIELGLVGSTMHQIDEATPVDDLGRLAAIYREILARYFAA